MNNSGLLFTNEKISISTISKMYNMLFNRNGLEVWHDTMYHYGEIPLLYLMSDELYKKILLQAGVSENFVQAELDLFNKRKHLAKQVMDTFKNIHFYSLESFLKLPIEPQIYIPNHCPVTNISLKLTKYDCKELLLLLVDTLQSNANLEVCFIPSRLFPDLHFSELWCKKNIGLYTYTSQESNNILTCHDIDFINQIATSFEQQHLFAPLEYKVKSSVIEKIQAIISRIK